MPFEITILGSSSATPTTNRHPSAQYLNLGDHSFLLDCGEGTQIQMLHYRLKHNHLSHIFISHLHADHYLGLAALIYTMNFYHRDKDLYIIGPQGLKEILEVHFHYSDTKLRFPVHYVVTNSKHPELIWDGNDITVHSIPLRHRIPTCGFIFREKPSPRKINPERCTYYNVPHQFFDMIKAGEDYVLPDGRLVANSELTIDPLPPRSYAYCSDTIYDNTLPELLQGIDLLYHESTFLQELAERAVETYHTTALQAARIAKAAKVKKLIIGHFSARYNHLQLLLDEARSEFPATELALEGRTFFISQGQVTFDDKETG